MNCKNKTFCRKNVVFIYIYINKIMCILCVYNVYFYENEG